MSKILHGGRLPSVRKDVVKFTSSMKDDKRLSKAVVEINKAHIIMLMEQKIIEWQVGAKLLQALNRLSNIKSESSAEDVHMAVEEAVTSQVGSEVGGNLHIAKSRNDQVTTAIRMELRKELVDSIFAVVKMQEALTKLAENHVHTPILEYTHLQPAQPVTFAHYLLSYVDALERDLQRIEELHKRVNLCPMGAGALATTSFPINRERVAELLGFEDILENSIDAVGSRDFILETEGALTIMATNLSRLAEDLIIWSSPDFGVVELPDSFSSTSSIMPQKKNPEILEIVRARASHVLGNFVASVATMKALPSTYNLDFQEITPKLWESLQTINDSLDMLSKLIPHLKVSADISNKALVSFVAATELANMLVRKYKVSFRMAHKIVGSLVRVLIESKLTFLDLTPELLQKVAQDSVGLTLKVGVDDICGSVDPLEIVESYNVRGGPSSSEVERMLNVRKQRLTQSKSNLSEKKLKQQRVEEKLQATVKSYSLAKSPLSQNLKIEADR